MKTFKMPGLEGKVAVVTGHRHGIGAAVVEALEGSGATVEGLDLPDDDLSNLESIAGRVARIEHERGRIDVLVNNAGVTNMGSIVETSLDELERVMAVNFKAPFLLMKAVLPGMAKRRAGSIVNNTSDQALIGKRYSAAYGASKAALAQLTKSAALDWAPHGIRVNAVAPGSTDTAMLRRVVRELHERYPYQYPKETDELYRTSVPLGRFATPSEIAWAIAFLASDAASFVTGVVLPVDGGGTAQ